MNLTRAEKVRLGTFVLVSVGLLVASTAILAGLRVFERRDAYTVAFAENVSGLERSAQVKYQGLRVGRVEAMRISPTDSGAIEVVLSLEEGTRLYEGTEAVLELSGITGLKIVNLVPGDPRRGVIAPGSRLSAGKSLIGRITGQAEVIAVKVESVANNLAEWTSDENRRRVESLIDSVNTLATHIDGLVVKTEPALVSTLEQMPASARAITALANESTATLKDLRGDVHRTLSEAEASLREVRRILGAADTKLVREALVSANAAMRSLDSTLSDARLGESIGALQNALASLTKLLGELDLAVRASREDFVLSLKHVRQATEDLREFSRIIAQDPSVLLRGRGVGD